MTIKDQLDGLLELAEELKQNIRYIAEDLGVDPREDGEDETASPEARVKLQFAEGVTPEELREALGYYRGLNEHRYGVETQERPLTDYEHYAVDSKGYWTVDNYLREKLGRDPSDVGARRLANSVLNNLPLAVDAPNPEVFSDNQVYFAKEMLDHVWDKFFKDREDYLLW